MSMTGNVYDDDSYFDRLLEENKKLKDQLHNILTKCAEDKQSYPFEPWIGVDLDGTLATYDCNAVWKGPDDIGAPVQSMVDRVRWWIDNGVTVKIVTARAAPGRDRHLYVQPVVEWCRRHIGFDLEVTAYKDGGMIELWDDRAVQVECNTGRRMDGKESAQQHG